MSYQKQPIWQNITENNLKKLGSDVPSNFCATWMDNGPSIQFKLRAPTEWKT
jgi:hypothetical protein